MLQKGIKKQPFTGLETIATKIEMTLDSVSSHICQGSFLIKFGI